MASIFDVLYRGGVVVQNGVRYTTVATPPNGENSTKVPTTPWVNKLADGQSDQIESATSGGMFPTIQNAVYVDFVSGVCAPSGGTWWVTNLNKSFAGGATINKQSTSGGAYTCIKIA